MNWIDYGIIAILALGVISGLRKGLVLSISSIICLLASIMVAKTYYKTVTKFLVKNTSLEEKIASFLSEKDFISNMLYPANGESPVFSISESFTSDVNSFVTVLLINAISVLMVFLAARLILSLAEGFLIGVVSIPGLREVNSIGGAFVGFVKNVIIIMLIFTIITPASAIKPLSSIAKAIEASTLANYFYTYNFILGWIWSAALDFLNK